VAAGRGNDADPRDLFATFLPTLTHGRPPLERVRLVPTTITRGKSFGEAYTTPGCEVGREAARRLHLPDSVQRSVYHVYELWRGRGMLAGRPDYQPLTSGKRRIPRRDGIARVLSCVA
jgi:hypothetical protein